MKKALLVLFMLILAAGVVFAGGDQEESMEGESTTTSTSTAPSVDGTGPVKIGYIENLTTTLAASLPWVDVGLNLAIKEINDNGGIKGRQIEVIKKDAANDPAITFERMSELKDAGVVAIVGPSSDSLSPTAAQWCEQNKMVSIQSGTASTKAYIDNATPYFFYSGFNAWMIGKVLALNTVEQMNAGSYVFMGTDGAAGIDVNNFFLEEAKKLNPKMRSKGDYRVGTTNSEFSTIVSAIMAADPDILVGGIAGPLFISFLEQAELFDLFSVVDYYGWYTADASNTQGFGEDFPAGHTHGLIAMPFWIQEEPAQKEFIQSWYDMGEALGYNFTVHPCDLGYGVYKAFMSLAAALEQAEDFETDTIAEAMHDVKIDLPWGNDAYYRRIDNMLITTTWYGTTAWHPDFVTPIGTDLVECGPETYPAEADILAVAESRGIDLKARMGLE